MNEHEFTLADRIQKIKSINELYDLEKNSYVALSGGKDSTVCLELALEVGGGGEGLLSAQVAEEVDAEGLAVEVGVVVEEVDFYALLGEGAEGGAVAYVEHAEAGGAIAGYGDADGEPGALVRERGGDQRQQHAGCKQHGKFLHGSCLLSVLMGPFYDSGRSVSIEKMDIYTKFFRNKRIITA